MHGDATTHDDEILATPGGLLDLLHVASVVLDAGGRIALWSPAMEQLLGYSAQEALGQRSDLLLVASENRTRARNSSPRSARGPGGQVCFRCGTVTAGNVPWSSVRCGCSTVRGSRTCSGWRRTR